MNIKRLIHSQAVRHAILRTFSWVPENILEMVALAEKLAEDFPFARVDFYNIKGKIYFGEITFYPWSGYVQYMPDEFDFELGSNFKLL